MAFLEDKWPFTPDGLQQILGNDALCVLVAGCSARLGNTLAIYDCCCRLDDFVPIESDAARQQREHFCYLLEQIDPDAVQNTLCSEPYTRTHMQTSWQVFHDSQTLFRSFAGNVGLLSATYAIVVYEQPVALLLAGPYRPDNSADLRIPDIDAPSGSVEAETRQTLLNLIDQMPAMPPNLPDRLKREAECFQRLAEAAFYRHKYQWEQDFLEVLRGTTCGSRRGGLDQLSGHLRDLLKYVRDFCQSDYVAFFTSLSEGNTVLAPLAMVGAPSHVEKNPPHFNWKKAGLQVDSHGVIVWDILKGPEMAAQGIRGNNSDFFADAPCVLPMSLGDRYCGVLVFGPFAEPISLQKEGHFLLEIADILSSCVFVELEVHRLQQERQGWQSTARLMMHQIGTALTPITSHIGKAKLQLQKLPDEAIAAPIVDWLTRAEDLSVHLSEGARETLDGHVLHVEPDDLVFELYPLSVLVANCVDSFTPEADTRHRQLILEKSVELLPKAEVDVARFTIAFSNLLNNALKYSYPNTKIYVRSSIDALDNPDQPSAVIEIDDIGDEIRLEDRERIFEEGTRGLTRAKLKRLAGSGLGLWEARAVIEAHGGKISVSCEETSIQRAQGTAYKVIFYVKVPLSQKKAKGKS